MKRRLSVSCSQIRLDLELHHRLILMHRAQKLDRNIPVVTLTKLYLTQKRDWVVTAVFIALLWRWNANEFKFGEDLHRVVS